MAAQALYLKYRPQSFDELVDQEPVTRTLRNALRQERLRHAYLFTGPRGTGKTTTARLLAKAVNCQAPQEERPCNDCAICVAINEGRLLDLIEIDAASNRGIDEIRDIREKVGFRPNEGRFKVYVLDEAHMLTEPAFNALLKTLEEPPPHVIFVLVTTDPHKIPATITSRCQRFDFKRVSLQGIVNRLAYIAGQEGVAVEPDALELIAHQGTGAMRDAISLLDQLASYGDEISLDQVHMVLGTVASDAAGKLAACLADGDVTGGLELINRTVEDGADPRQLGREVVEYLRGLLLIKHGAGTRLLNVPAEQASEMEALAARMPAGRLVHAIQLFNAAITDVKTGLQVIPQLPLEMALVESLVEPVLPVPAPGLGSQHQEPGPPAKTAKTSEPQAETHPASMPAQSAQPKPEARRIAEPPVSAAPSALAEQRTDPQPEPIEPEPGHSDAETLPSTGLPTLAQVEGSWNRVLQLVRQQNPATQGVLNTGCKPVEVIGNEIVVTFPFAFLREKLSDPQRRVEIQDALSQVLGAKCSIKLVLAADYTPRTAAQPVRQAPAERSASPPQPSAGPGAGQVPGPISDWAREHGGEIELVD